MSNQSVTTHKFAAVLNKKIEPGKAMNALAHMSLALMFKGGHEFTEQMGFVDYMDADTNSHVATKNSYVILRADNSNKIRFAREIALAHGVLFRTSRARCKKEHFLINSPGPKRHQKQNLNISDFACSVRSKLSTTSPANSACGSNNLSE